MFCPVPLRLLFFAFILESEISEKRRCVVEPLQDRYVMVQFNNAHLIWWKL